MLVVTTTGAGPSSSSNGWRITSSIRSATSSGATVQSAPSIEHHELVAAHAADRVGVAQRARQPGRDRQQQPVAGLVPERVVDVLELVQVDEQRRRRSSPLRRLRASSCSMRSMISARFGSPVNASCNA